MSHAEAKRELIKSLETQAKADAQTFIMRIEAEAKAEADKKYKKHSAYKSGWVVKRYKELGGRYKGEPAGLKRWFAEKWQDVGSKEGDYPLYRPTKRVSKDTPKTADEVGELRLLVQDKLKQKIKGRKNLPPF